MGIRDDKEIKAIQSGSEGWAVFKGHKMIASHLTKHGAEYIVKLLTRIEKLELQVETTQALMNDVY